MLSRTVKNLLDNSVISTETFTYDAAGNVTDAPDLCFEYDTNNRLTKFCNNTISYDLDGNIVRSIDILANREYNYEYEEGKIVRATESDIELSGDIVTSKAIVNTVKYY